MHYAVHKNLSHAGLFYKGGLNLQRYDSHHTCLSGLFSTEDIRVTSVSDRHHGHSVELSAGSSQVGVAAGVVVDSALGQHSVVLNLGLSQGRGVVGDDDHLGLAVAKSLEGGLVSKSGLSRLHDELDLSVDGLNVLLGSLLGGRGSSSRSRSHSC